MDISRTRLSAFAPTWDSYDFGAVDKLTFALELITKPIKVGSVGDVVLGERIIGLGGNITIEAREVDRALLNKMLPWAGTSPPSSLSLLPTTFHKDLYDYAKLLKLHPRGIGNETEDLNLLKAVPRWKAMDKDGINDDKVMISFSFFPDRSVLETGGSILLTYGYVGPVPS